MNAATRFEIQVRRAIERHRMLAPNDRVLVAASGGADSTALLICLHRLAPKLQITVSAAHLHHGLRGREADEDAAFVRALCERHGIPCAAERLDLSARASSARRNLEEKGREMRRAALRRIAGSEGAARIALGHNRNDQAETVLMRLLRGSGLTGLAAIRPVVDGLFIRPLLELSRHEILGYLDALEITFREDSSNRDFRFRRNRVRHELLPYIEEHFNPRAARTLARHAKIAAAAADFLEGRIRAALESARLPSSDGISLRADDLHRLHPFLQSEVLRAAFREARGSLRRLATRHTDSLANLCRPGQSGRMIELPGGVTAVRQFGELRLARFTAAAVPFAYELPLPGSLGVPELGLRLCARIELRRALPRDLRSEPSRAYLDAGALPDRLQVRSRQPGDRYGGPRSRKVKKMLIDARIPLQRRPSLPMVATGDAVVWIPGFSPAKSFAARDDSDRCVVLEIEDARQGPGGRSAS